MPRKEFVVSFRCKHIAVSFSQSCNWFLVLRHIACTAYITFDRNHLDDSCAKQSKCSLKCCYFDFVILLLLFVHLVVNELAVLFHTDNESKWLLKLRREFPLQNVHSNILVCVSESIRKYLLLKIVCNKSVLKFLFHLLFTF